MEKSTRCATQYAKNATIRLSAWMMTLVLCLLLTTSCQSFPGEGINVAYPLRPVDPELSFEDVGGHCIDEAELRRLGVFYIDSKAYFDVTEAILDAVNGK